MLRSLVAQSRNWFARLPSNSRHGSRDHIRTSGNPPLWDFSIQTEVVLDKRQKLCLVIDVACPFDTRIKKKEQEKIEYYNDLDLKYEILKCWNKEVDKVMILPIVIGALETVTNNLRKNLDKVDLHLGVDALQKTCLLGTARIIRKVLDTK